MSTKPSLHPSVMDARSRIRDQRERARQQHQRGASGKQVCYFWTDAVDNILIDLLKAAAEVSGFDPEYPGVAMVAHSGYGRRDLAPFSDIDLTLIYARRLENRIVPLVRAVGQMVVDAGLQLGFATRTTAQARTLAWNDPEVFTSLTASRLLWGDQGLFERYADTFRTGATFRCRRLVPAILDARRDERHKFGETNYLLHPNIKRSRGGLRDVQLVRWIGFARYGEASLDQLEKMQLLTGEDYRALEDGLDYLLRLRNQLHFMAGRAEDTMDRSKQLLLAEWSGCCGQEGILPVEQFMQRYFAYTSGIRYASAHFAESARNSFAYKTKFGRIFSRALGANYRMGLREIWPNTKYLESLKDDPAKILELMLLANTHGRRIDHGSWSAIRRAMLCRPPAPPSNQTVARFSQLMQEPRKLGPTLRRLHELRVLEQIIPAFEHARFLLQFNEYHKYTVDTHCIRAVDLATEFANRQDVLGETYRSLKPKALLHLALLIHDLGKGFSEDHSDVGARIAAETADLLRLEPAEKEMLVFLVHKHLVMAHTAFRYDLSDRDTIVSFASQVGSVEALRMLFILTCADLDAVGPGTLNDWKLNLIVQLYQATLAHFGAGKTGPEGDFVTEVEIRRREVVRLTESERPQSWWGPQVAAIPPAYLLSLSPEEVVAELRRLQALSDDSPIDVWGSYLPQQDAIQYAIAFRQTAPIGAFARITGALTSQRLEILSGEVHTQPGAIVWDRFLVSDPDYSGPPPQERIARVCEQVLTHLKAESIPTPTFGRVWLAKTPGVVHRSQPVQVRFDNATSDKYTIVTVFAYDRTGLLYDISRILWSLEVVLHTAKISTHLDQVVDVFYVTSLDGQKLTESTRLYTLRQQLLRAIDPQDAA